MPFRKDNSIVLLHYDVGSFCEVGARLTSAQILGFFGGGRSGGGLGGEDRTFKAMSSEGRLRGSAMAATIRQPTANHRRIDISSPSPT